MYEYTREIKKHGTILPKNLSTKINKTKLIQNNICSNYKTLKFIDTYKNLPEEFSNEYRTKVKEILIIEEILIVLLNFGHARAYNHILGKLLCEINPNKYANVHTLVHNTFNDTLIVAYAVVPAHLQCKIINISDIKLGKIKSCEIAIDFEKVLLTHPAFFEFCDTNGRIGAANLNTNTYTFWDMKNYQPVFKIQEQFQEIRVSDGLLAMFKQPIDNIIPLSLYDISDGKLLIKTVVEILPYKEIQFLELLASKLLIKQENSSLRLYDLLKNTRQKVKNTNNFQPLAFVFYDHPTPLNGKPYKNYINKRFFTISYGVINFWELDFSILKNLFSINVPGLNNSDLCIHSLTSEIICLYSYDISRNLKDYELYKDNVYLEKNIQITNNENNINNFNEFDNEKNKKKKIINFINNKNINKLNKDYFNFGSLLLFSLDNGIFLKALSENLCGKNVQVIASNETMSTIVCGDNKGIIRIIRNNPFFDEYNIKTNKIDIKCIENDDTVTTDSDNIN